jgi:hypothetical protein
MHRETQWPGASTPVHTRWSGVQTPGQLVGSVVRARTSGGCVCFRCSVDTVNTGDGVCLCVSMTPALPAAEMYVSTAPRAAPPGWRHVHVQDRGGVHQACVCAPDKLCIARHVRVAPNLRLQAAVARWVETRCSARIAHKEARSTRMCTMPEHTRVHNAQGACNCLPCAPAQPGPDATAAAIA